LYCPRLDGFHRTAFIQDNQIVNPVFFHVVSVFK
jgi:hypothetical protein